MRYLDLAKQAVAHLDVAKGVYVEPSLPSAFSDGGERPRIAASNRALPAPEPGHAALDHAALDHAATLRDAWRRACFELGETASWPELPFKPGTSVAPGEAPWRLWMKRASVPDMVMVVGALQNVLSQYVRDGE